MDQKISVKFAAGFYFVMAVTAIVLGTFVWPSNLLEWHDRTGWSRWGHLGLGAGVGLVTVLVSNLLERVASWARVLSEEFAKLLGGLALIDTFMLALFSSVAEELFFRAFLQQALTDRMFDGDVWMGLTVTAIIFGGVHMGPDWRKFWPWTVMATVMGGVLGWMYLYTGNILAPTFAHFTINFLNLTVIVSKHREG